VPFASEIIAHAPDVLGEGGTCVANPDGSWLLEPIAHEERLVLATCDHRRVREERQNFDPVGHYARPDVLQLTVNRERQRTARFVDDA
jgi:nitrilase